MEEVGTVSRGGQLQGEGKGQVGSDGGGSGGCGGTQYARLDGGVVIWHAAPRARRKGDAREGGRGGGAHTLQVDLIS